MSVPLTLLIVAEPRGHRRGQLLHRSLLKRQVDSKLLLLGSALELGPEESCAEVDSIAHVQWLLSSLGWNSSEFCLAVGTEAFDYLPSSCPHRLLDCQRVEQVDRWAPKSLAALQRTLDSWRGFQAPRVNHESRALHGSELVFTCNPLVRQVLVSLYPRLAGKIHEPPLWLTPLLEEEKQHYASNPRSERIDPYAHLAEVGELEWCGAFSWEEEAIYQAALCGCRLSVRGDCGNGSLARGALLEEYRRPHPAEELMEVLPALR